MAKYTTTLIAITIWMTILSSSLQIYVPDEEIDQKPVTYTSGIKTSSYQRPHQLNVNHNYSNVYHHNSNSYTPSFSGDDRTSQQRLYPVYNAHTYGSRPNAKLTQVYVLNGSRIGQNSNPTRQIVIYNKQKRTPKVQVYRACPKNATGQFVYESSCNQFLNCWKGRGYVQNCAPGSLFNPKTLECDFPDKVSCISGPRESILENGRKSRNLEQIGCPKDFSGLIPNYTDCSKFINCVSGIENFMDCPPGTLFDINKNICDFAHKATCFNGENQKLIERNIDGKLDFTPSRETQRGQERQQLRYRHNEVRCPYGAEGLYKHPTDCSRYLNCANGETYVQSCAPGTLFNPELKICDFPYNVVCRNGTEGGISVVDYDAGYYQRNRSSGYYGNSNTYGRHDTTPYSGGYHVGQPRPYSTSSNGYGGTQKGSVYGSGSSIYDENGPSYGSSGYGQTQYSKTPHTYGSGYGVSGNQYGSSHTGSGTYGLGSYGDSSTNRYINNEQNRQFTGSGYPSGSGYMSGSGYTSGSGYYDNNSNRRVEDQYQVYGNSGNQYGNSQGSTQHNSQPYGSDTYRPSQHATGQQTHYGSSNLYTDTQNGGTQQRYNKGSTSGQYPGSYPSASYDNQNRDGWRQDPYQGNHQNSGFYITRPTNWNQNQNSRVDTSHDPNWNSNQNTRVDGNYDQNYLGATTLPYDSSNIYSQRPLESGQRTNLAGSYATYPKSYNNNQGSYSNSDRNSYQGTNDHNRDRTFTNYNHGNDLGEGSLYGQSSTQNRRNEFQQGQRGETGYGRWYGQNGYRDGPTHQQGHQDSWQSQPSNNLDEEGITSNYDQVVNINQRKTTRVPFRNSYEPFFGTTSVRPGITTSRSNDYDDTFVPGHSRKYIRSTTPKVLEKIWPPPFPSTDVNADYVFEYDDNEEVTLEAENTVKNNLQKNNNCDKSEFVCANEKCISKTLVCNGIKDCPSGNDEQRCLEYVSRFSIKKNQKLAILEKERWDNVSIAACALMCVETQKLRCKSFNYRKIDNTCFLTNTNEGLTGALISYYPFDYYELISEKINCTGMYICNNKKCIDRKKICDGHDDCGDRMDEKGCKAQDFNYSIRLTGSRNKNEGLIEVSAFGKTGYVCDDKFGLRDAHVVCKELGFHLGAVEVKGNSFFAKEFTPEKTFYMMDDVTCSGNETKLLDCDFSGWGVHNCLAQEIAGVVCKTPTEKCASDYWQCDTGRDCLPLAFVCDGLLDCPDGSDEGTQHCDAPTQVRLVNGTNQRQGRVEIRYHGTWGTICDDDFNEDAAKVVCQQLGFKGAAVVKKDAYFGAGVGPIWLDQVFCAGNETSIENCSHWNWAEHNCDHNEDVGVICSNTYEYVERHSQALPARMPQDYPERCGYRKDNIFNRNDDVHFRVVKGSVAKSGDYPWQAAIRVKGKTSTSHWCGAVIISQKFVLTAAHCLIGYSKGAYVIVAGDYNVDEHEGTEQEARIEDYYLHENFRQGHKMNNDIALVKLKGRGFQLNDDVQAICLPDADTNYDAELNCTISGFGSIESGKSAFSHNLRAGWVPLQKREICAMPHVYGEALTEGMICAGSLDEGIDSCDGDSGGPLACLDTGVFTLYGITSWGQHCGYANKPGVYVKVAHYKKWIDDNFKKYSFD
ncbi:hypothetical protein Zmor_018121 [Zophobas morio]|uniref:Uncharacterized protein n=1 Tax=Zophobas morio TaxID=2755281 RepID=A0AA38IBJ5_9CUCU|nr:hypothetical protein Zmor_018121 [Zophobas morio]